MEPESAPTTVLAHDGWRRAVVGLGMGALLGLVVRWVVGPDTTEG